MHAALVPHTTVQSLHHDPAKEQGTHTFTSGISTHLTTFSWSFSNYKKEDYIYHGKSSRQTGILIQDVPTAALQIEWVKPPH